MADAVDHEIKPPTIRPSACRVGASALSCVLPSRTRTMAWCVPGSCGSAPVPAMTNRSEEHTSELQSLMRISYAVFCLKKQNKRQTEVHTKRIIMQQYTSTNINE